MASVEALPDRIDSFSRLFAFEYCKTVVTLYRCDETGLRVALASVQSPTVHGYLTVQTEAFDDSGSPHTLEHLTFLGSERYPYKGVLDVLANRCLAQGTNAWTDVDHTCYTVDTAGPEGFLRILPVFLDHVLFPTLKDSGFVTEVHHINGEGANAGVVYCEMQATENEADEMMDRAMKLAVYPGRCSYKSETGGRLKELRELTNKTVREYHSAYYRPENLCVIVTGQVDATELCRSLHPVVESIKGSSRIKELPPFQRPFSSPVERPLAPVEEQIEFPAEDEKTGAMCVFAWHGPTWEKWEIVFALRVLLTYLTQDSISPLQQQFVETSPSLCGSVSHSLHEQTTYLIELSLRNVDVQELSKRNVGEEVTNVLRAAAASDGCGINLDRMRSLIRQQRRQHLSELEESPHELYSGQLIGCFLYASDFEPCESPGAALRGILDAPSRLDNLLSWTAEQWAALCDEWLVGAQSCPRISVTGVPSKAFGERIQKEDEDRIKAQRESLGEKGCEDAAAALEAAEQENDVDTPDEVSQSFAVPDVGSVRLVDVATVFARNGKDLEETAGCQAPRVRELLAASDWDARGELAPTLRFDHVDGSQFVECSVMMPIEALTSEELALLPLWSNVAFELPLEASDAGDAMSYEQNVQALTDLAVWKGFSIGMGGDAHNLVSMIIKVESARYSEAASWLARLLGDVKFDCDRLHVAAKRILSDVPNSKRNSETLMQSALCAMSYRDDCSIGAMNIFKLERTLAALVEGDGKEAMEKAATILDGIRKRMIANPGALSVRIAGDISTLGAEVFKPWCRAPFLGERNCSPPRPMLSRELFATDALALKAQQTGGCLVSSTTEESNHWILQVSSLSDPESPELAPLLVALEYVTALEGPFWRKIRGKGLAYHYSLSHSLEEGLLKFILYKATDPIAAYLEARKIVLGMCDSPQEREQKDGQPEHTGDDLDEEEEEEEEERENDEDCEDEDEQGLDPFELEAAQSGVLFSLIQTVDTIPNALDSSFLSSLKRKRPDYLVKLLKAVQEVSEEEVSKALRKYVLPLFDGSCGRVVSLVCPAQKRKEVEAGLRKLEPPLRVLHVEVDALVAAVARADGFSSLRAQVRTAASAKDKSKGKGKGRGKKVGSAAKGKGGDKGKGSEKLPEKRIDPEDGCPYTFEELSSHYAGQYKKADIRQYWEGCAVERRIDPDDGQAYTLQELATFYARTYKRNEILAYWNSCKLVAAKTSKRRRKRGQ